MPQPELPARQHGKSDVTTLEKYREEETFYPHCWQSYCLKSPKANEVSGNEMDRCTRFPAKTLLKDCDMEFEDYDFTRNPVVQNQVFFLESKCSCGFSILARSIEELVEQEAFHRLDCKLADAVT
jgi:hypothetical protein